jgi:hypothetical protein
MGNYKEFELEFLDRTMKLIDQYEIIMHQFEFDEQYNYTLLINCLLGVVVLPNARLGATIPNDRITARICREMGLEKSTLGPKYTTIRALIVSLRNSISYMSVEVISNDQRMLIDEIVFKTQGNQLVARFKAQELLPFMRYYVDWVKANTRNNIGRKTTRGKKTLIK